MARPRWMLHVQAQFWRMLMGIGMIFHRLAPPRPPSPSFSRTVTSTVSPRRGTFSIQFYVPKDYFVQTQAHGRRYPVVVNYHGGGFTLGTAADDARWAQQVVEEVGAVVASVDYRLAPEHPFPTAIEDGADAVLYLARSAADLGLDPDRMAVSGFSSGGNMALTVPLLLRQVAAHADFSASSSSIDTMTAKTPNASRDALISARDDVQLRGIVSWYPSTDYTQTREQRRNTCARKDQLLPAVFTELFDESYLQPPTMDMANPFLSPGVAPPAMLAGLPPNIVLFTCEYDMLLAEGERIRDRLRDEARKHVYYRMVPGVPHGWDKAPNPLRETPGIRGHYHDACNELKRMFSS